MMSLKLSSMKRELHLKPSIRSCMNRCTLRYAYTIEHHLKQRCSHILIFCSYFPISDSVTKTLLLTCFVCTRAEIGNTSMLRSMAFFLS